MPNLRLKTRSFAISLVCCCAAVLTGCASVPVPVERLSAAQAAIEQAQSLDANANAPVELTLAKDFLAQAQAASAAKDQQRASDFAERAKLHAELAAVKAQHAKTRAAVLAADKRNTDLLNEIRAEGPNRP
jgi:hypothetical protein